ncbi:hypothetical protein GA0070606_0042 [Micromonospora citrea]|uniref:Uncharacterized protein n=1 Tax=Micromonospora citrea TaxID=47855 RepID=A0A1C6TQF3_9ACTN|nr:hypothetical protein [Micromonospora citrea]SCL43851.1 hypothetical protein GA0070606_0042 [Micromonospora citrea]
MPLPTGRQRKRWLAVGEAVAVILRIVASLVMLINGIDTPGR